MKKSIQFKKVFFQSLPKIISFSILFFNSTILSQQITGLSGWNIYIDPGHSQNENMGIYGYSEAEKNLGVALNLREMLLDLTDIDTVYLSRDNDQVLVSLTQRTDEANSLGAAWYHSIHSNAGDASTNNTLLLWGQYESGMEKFPIGGKMMSDLMIPILTEGMRIPTIGSWGDHDFYGKCPTNPARPCPYLWVNYATDMPSELSEAGFHTNPTQNQLNMNVNWKRLEAKTMFWTFLKYFLLPRPFVGTVAGILKDTDTGLPVNGAIVSLDGKVDTTDTYQSLFYKYSSDPEQLRNGFYYFENIAAGTHQLKITAAGYDTLLTNVTVSDTFFTFKDINLISNIPFTVSSTDPTQNDSLYPGKKNITINFSKAVNPSTLDQNLNITPSVFADYNLTNSNRSLVIITQYFANNTDYQISLTGNLEDIYGHQLDGNGDGIAGDDFMLNIKTKVLDTNPPSVAETYPIPDAINVELKPIISVSFDELLNTTTISNGIKIIKNSDQTNVTPTLRTHYAVNGRSVVNYFVRLALNANESYTIQILPGLQDELGNSVQSEMDYQFTTGNSDYSTNHYIDNFDGNLNNSWYQPEQSGSTTGIIPLLTNFSSVTSIKNLITLNNIGSAMFEYAYDESSLNWLIREYRTVASPTFDRTGLLQVYLFGDGNNNMFRFCIKEINGTSPTNLEVSPWYNINWIGWKVVNWDLTEGQTGNWLGNGILEPPFIFDSFQFTYQQENTSQGTYYFDDLRTASLNPTNVRKEDNQLPASFGLEQNYPNPFNPSTKIKFSIAKESNVRLIVTDILGRSITTLVNDNLASGNYSVTFDGKNIASGIYFYTLIADNFKQTHKMILMK